MKKLKNETELMKEALRVGKIYAEKRAANFFSQCDNETTRIQFIYQLLVQDKLIQPLAKQEENVKNIKRKLAFWISRQLPSNHKLLQ